MSDSIVTEYWLAQNFTPKSGVTPGSDNLQAMDCDQIAARYQVSISGTTTTGLRLPAQNQITSAAIDHTITRIGFHGVTAQTASTINMTLSLSSSTKMLVVTIKAMWTSRQSGTITWNGVPMTKAISSNGSEIWYITPPATGTYVLSIPNSSNENLQIGCSWYSCGGNINLYSTNQGGAMGTSISQNVSIPQNTSIMLVDSVCLRSSLPSVIGFSGNSGSIIWAGIEGAAFGSASQDKGWDNGALTSYSMIWSLTEAMNWVGTVACFYSS